MSPNCQNCDGWVSRTYKLVKGHPKIDGEVPTCQQCVGKQRAGKLPEDIEDNAAKRPDDRDSWRAGSIRRGANGGTSQ